MAGNGFFNRRFADSVAYLLGLLLFFLPFVELKSKAIEIGDMKIEGFYMKSRGIDLATGTSASATAGDTTLNINKGLSSDREIFALLAALFGLAALIISFLTFRKRPLVSAVAGLLAAISMTALYFDLENTMRETKQGSADILSGLGVTMGFTLWFYLSLLCFLIGTLLSFMQNNRTSAYDQAPRRAPQLDIENPGDQSEFPKSASESELG